MLLKEYRVCMPLTVDEYRIGQLYMIAKHSSQESRGGEGVEVVTNEACHDPEHGDGQFTEKRIYLAGRMPSWTQSLIPKIFYVTEKSWNYYPFTITEYTCSFLPRFQIKIETRYRNDNGCQENVTGLSPDMLAQREVVHIDIASDDFTSGMVTPDQEDCSKFKSTKTGRGPLSTGWKERSQPIMCSYKVIKVFFEVWGLQGRVESGVHRAIRDILLKGHKEAFLWMDEWHGMNIDDVREYELKMQEDTNRLVLDGVPAASESTTKAGTTPAESTTKAEASP